jgi:phosphoglycolate phosphatase-like HAD superfamily hydrolase
LADIQLLPGARELLGYLTQAEIPWAIATSGRIETARPLLAKLDVDFDRTPIVTRDKVKYVGRRRPIRSRNGNGLGCGR